VGARRRRLAWGRRGEGRRRPPRPRLQESINQEKERGEPEEEIYIFNSFYLREEEEIDERARGTTGNGKPASGQPETCPGWQNKAKIFYYLTIKNTKNKVSTVHIDFNIYSLFPTAL
jgi:hypothetical protein